jgi:hypothetical protein
MTLLVGSRGPAVLDDFTSSYGYKFSDAAGYQVRLIILRLKLLSSTMRAREPKSLFMGRQFDKVSWLLLKCLPGSQLCLRNVSELKY